MDNIIFNINKIKYEYTDKCFIWKYPFKYIKDNIYDMNLYMLLRYVSKKMFEKHWCNTIHKIYIATDVFDIAYTKRHRECKYDKIIDCITSFNVIDYHTFNNANQYEKVDLLLIALKEALYAIPKKYKLDTKKLYEEMYEETQKVKEKFIKNNFNDLKEYIIDYYGYEFDPTAFDIVQMMKKYESIGFKNNE